MKLCLTLSLLAIFSLSHFVAPLSKAEKLPRTPSAKEAQVYILSPQNGEVVSSPVKVVFGLRGMGIAPAGVKYPNSGHHHLLIDSQLPSEELPMPASDQLKHFGKGQTETVIPLQPGKHTLQLVLGDHLHIPHQPVVRSKVIQITVK